MNDYIKCPYCGYESEQSDFPDFLYEDPSIDKQQYTYFKSINDLGYNIVTCGYCGSVILQKINY